MLSMSIHCRIHMTDNCSLSFKFRKNTLKEPDDIREAFNRVINEVPNMDCVRKLELEII